MDRITHDVRSSQWLEIITQCQNRPQGTTAKQWMTDNGISEKSYYYWLRKFRKRAYSQMKEASTALSAGKEISFAEVSISPKQSANVAAFTPESSVEVIRPVAVIKNANISFALTNEISEDLLSRILLEVAHA
ncbi:MAG: IS66 family insertion sequence element accessory protein TnpB [Lachnospiraceae bacterium]|nr:IS66 family insertion sequence element accessory protein TnpB [Lachnospiraceae bacterium]